MHQGYDYQLHGDHQGLGGSAPRRRRPQGTTGSRGGQGPSGAVHQQRQEAAQGPRGQDPPPTEGVRGEHPRRRRPDQDAGDVQDHVHDDQRPRQGG